MSYWSDLKDYSRLGKKEVPGLLFCVLVASASYVVTRGTLLDGGPRLLDAGLFQSDPFFSTLYKIGPIVLALIIGLLVNLSPLRQGAGYAGKYLLRIAIVLMGARVTADVLSKASLVGVAIILVVMTFTIWLSLFLGRKASLERDAAALIGTGNAICGVSACLSVAPVINAKSSHVFAVIGVISLLGLVAVFTVPWIASDMGLTTSQAEVLIGGSVHEIGNVIPASDLYHNAFGGEDVTSLVLAYKMVRVGMLVVVAYVLSRLFIEDKEAKKAKIRPQGFLLAFVGMAVLASLMIIMWPNQGSEVRSAIVSVSSTILTVAMAGVGLSMDLKETIRVGRKLLPITLLVWVAQLSLLIFLVKVLI